MHSCCGVPNRIQRLQLRSIGVKFTNTKTPRNSCRSFARHPAPGTLHHVPCTLQPRPPNKDLRMLPPSSYIMFSRQTDKIRTLHSREPAKHQAFCIAHIKDDLLFTHDGGPAGQKSYSTIQSTSPPPDPPSHTPNPPRVCTS